MWKFGISLSFTSYWSLSWEMTFALSEFIFNFFSILMAFGIFLFLLYRTKVLRQMLRWSFFIFFLCSITPSITKIYSECSFPTTRIYYFVSIFLVILRSCCGKCSCTNRRYGGSKNVLGWLPKWFKIRRKNALRPTKLSFKTSLRLNFGLMNFLKVFCHIIY